jgi:hypothetical protein
VLVLNFYQINRDSEIRTRDRLVIKTLIPCQRTISTQKVKLLGKIPRYDLYYSLTPSKYYLKKNKFLATIMIIYFISPFHFCSFGRNLIFYSLVSMKKIKKVKLEVKTLSFFVYKSTIEQLIGIK